MNTKILLGWKEYCALPRLRIPLIVAKIDTGADTSCLHACNIEPFLEHGEKHVRFDTHPRRFDDDTSTTCIAPVVDYRMIRSSNGDHEQRYIVETEMILGGNPYIIDISLTDRSELNFRMLLGRQFLKGHSIVDVALSLQQGKPNSQIYLDLCKKYEEHYA